MVSQADRLGCRVLWARQGTADGTIGDLQFLAIVSTRSEAVATYPRLDEGAKVWIEGATLVGKEKVRVERALAGWA
jgi:hypothetical protein